MIHKWAGNSEHAQRGVAGLQTASSADLTHKV